VREQHNPKTWLTRDVTVFSTDKSRSRRNEDDDEYGSSDLFAGDDEGPKLRTPYDDDEEEAPARAASATASRAYGTNFADIEVNVGDTNWADMDIPSMDLIETHARRNRRAPAARVAAAPAAKPMGLATIALVKLFIVLGLSIAIAAAAVTFMFQRMGIGSFR